ncbi:MAG: globin domain-containing protein [Acidobacteriota bacterium]|nr:globin domain-containing protein [Acidobacteriota bacterium]
MRPEQINLLQQNFASLEPQAEAVATVFYNRLFAMKPTLRLLFSADLTDQKKKLMTMLGLAVKSLDQLDALVPVLENLGRRHALYGVRREHYDDVRASLLATLRDALGREFTPDACNAWADMYDFVSATMKRAADEIAADIEKSKIYFQETQKMPKKITVIG